MGNSAEDPRELNEMTDGLEALCVGITEIGDISSNNIEAMDDCSWLTTNKKFACGYQNVMLMADMKTPPMLKRWKRFGSTYSQRIFEEPFHPQ